MRPPWFLLVAAIVLAAVPGSAPAASLTVAALTETGPSSAVVRWQASAPVRVVVEYGLDERYGVWSQASTPASAGTALLGGLEPGTTYRYRVLAETGGRRTRTAGTFTTGLLPARTAATTTRNALLLDGQPFFPRMVFRQCRWAFGSSIASGINTFMGGCTSDRELVEHLGGRAAAIPGIASRLDGRGVIGWHQLDEADLSVGPGALPLLPHSSRTQRVVFLTLSSHFWQFAAPGPLPRDQYPAMVARAEMVGTDLYPLQSWCRRAFGAVFAAQRELVALAAGKPTFQWIEAGLMADLGCPSDWHFEPTPQTVRAETWLAIAGGARGIGYFPDNWQPPIAEEIRRLNREIAALAPALLSDELPVRIDLRGPIKVGAHSYNGAVYVIAVNSTVKRWVKGFSVPGLRTRTVRVFGEGRELLVGPGGRIVDTFAPLSVHVYVAAPPES